jgi:choline dehydrogenase
VDAPVLDHGLTPPPGHGVTVGVVLLQPGSRGHVRLASDDPADPPVIDPGYLTAETDLPRLVAGLRTATEILAADALRPYVGAPMAPWTGDTDDDSLARFVRGHAETLYHPVGTCRMGTDDGSVVDTELRVRGLAGLRVVDASVLPMINRGHTLAPTIMIAERAADLIGTSTADRDARSGGSI